MCAGVCECASECVGICVCLKLQIKRNRNELKSLWSAKQTTQHTKPRRRRRRRRRRRISAECKEGSETVATVPSTGLQLTDLGVALRCCCCCCSSCGLVAGSDPAARARRSCESCSLSLAFSMPTFVPFGQHSARQGKEGVKGRGASLDGMPCFYD